MKTIQEIAEFCCDNPNLDDIFEEITKISAEATRLERERCLGAVDAEPEFPDEMPDDMWIELSLAVLEDDKTCIEECFRLAIRAAKAGIKARIEGKNG